MADEDDEIAKLQQERAGIGLGAAGGFDKDVYGAGAGGDKYAGYNTALVDEEPDDDEPVADTR